MNLNKAAEAERFLSAPPAAVRAAVIHGRDRSGVRERADRLAARLVPDAADPFAVGLISEGESDDGARIADELSALSLLGGARLVRLQLAEKAGADRAAADALKAHLDGRYNPDAFLLIEAGALAKDSGLRRAAEAAKTAACLPVYEDEPGDLTRLVRESLARNGVSLTSEALELFTARLPKERGVLRQEVERLVLYLGPNSGVVGDVELLADHLGATAEASLSDAALDAAGGRVRPALDGLNRAAAEGEGGVAAVRVMGQHLGRLRRIRVAVDGGTAPQTAAKAAGVFWKAEREILRQHRAWTAPALDGAQAETAAADRACKAAGAPDTLIAERLYLGIAAQARRLGL
jgi:DNA polymerase-3 subunit delta